MNVRCCTNAKLPFPTLALEVVCRKGWKIVATNHQMVPNTSGKRSAGVCVWLQRLVKVLPLVISMFWYGTASATAVPGGFVQ